MKIVEYKIISAHDGECLERKVNSSIRNGWQPIGGGAVCLEAAWGGQSKRFHLAQAMVKYEGK